MHGRPALVLLSLSTVLLAGCGSGADPDTVAADDNPVLTSPSAASSSAANPSAAPSPAAPAVRIITAAFTGGDIVVDSSRVETALGEQVVLRISSDVAEEVHVHGYDVYTDIPAGGAVDIPLTLTLPGSYEVELHNVGRPLFQLRTS